MNFKKYFKQLTLLLIVVLTATVFVRPADYPKPQEKELLNGLKLLTWKIPGAKKVRVSLRIHRGAAFDLQGKEGTMALLGDILFPGEVARESFEEDLGGSLDIKTTYDYIQIDATADNKELLNVLQTLANAVLNPLIDKENTALVKESRLARVKQLEKDPAYLAEREVKKRLFGNFPYGRPIDGTPESLEKIDFADLIFARQRFLTSDNATLVVAGDVQPNFVYRAVRRYFGNWLKADEKVPAYFRVPDEPKTGVAIRVSPRENSSELRYAFRGPARGDKDYFAALILARILEGRLRTAGANKFSVSPEAHFLPGYVIISSRDWNLGKISRNGDTVSLPQDIDTKIHDALKKPITLVEFEQAREMEDPPSLFKHIERWLDADTYRLGSVSADQQNGEKVAMEDVVKLAERWRGEPVTGILIFLEAAPAEKKNPEEATTGTKDQD